MCIRDSGLFQQDFITGQYSETARDAAAVMMLTSSYIFDNTIYGYTGPIDGVRNNTTLRISPGLGASKLIFTPTPNPAMTGFIPSGSE